MCFLPAIIRIERTQLDFLFHGVEACGALHMGFVAVGIHEV